VAQARRIFVTSPPGFYPIPATRFSKSLASMARRTARRNGTVETEPKCRLIAGKRQLDGLARQCRGSPSSNISAARVAQLEEPRGRPSGLPDRPLASRLRRSRAPCSPCFISSRSGTSSFRSLTRRRHRRFLNDMKHEHYGNFAVFADTAMMMGIAVPGLVPEPHIFVSA
jgi:hypothetical protein